MHTGFWWGTLRMRNSLEDLRVDGRIILKLIFNKWDGVMNCFDLVQERDS